jgi:hypothetical protein
MASAGRNNFKCKNVKSNVTASVYHVNPKTSETSRVSQGHKVTISQISRTLLALQSSRYCWAFGARPCTASDPAVAYCNACPSIVRLCSDCNFTLLPCIIWPCTAWSPCTANPWSLCPCTIPSCTVWPCIVSPSIVRHCTFVPALFNPVRLCTVCPCLVRPYVVCPSTAGPWPVRHCNVWTCTDRHCTVCPRIVRPCTVWPCIFRLCNPALSVPVLCDPALSDPALSDPAMSVPALSVLALSDLPQSSPALCDTALSSNPALFYIALFVTALFHLHFYPQRKILIMACRPLKFLKENISNLKTIEYFLTGSPMISFERYSRYELIFLYWWHLHQIILFQKLISGS